MPREFDPISLEIMWSRLISVVDEAAATLVRTSFSTIVKESNDYACMLMLQPIDGVHNTPQFEFLGNAGSTSSPCSPSGLAGGSKGPLVPALVQ